MASQLIQVSTTDETLNDRITQLSVDYGCPKGKILIMAIGLLENEKQREAINKIINDLANAISTYQEAQDEII